MWGHGVEFFHDAYGKIPVAFLEGFEWMRTPGKPVTVEILHQESKVFAGGSVDPRLVLEEVKEAVQYFLFTPSAQKQGLFGGKVTAWFNG
jgi:hypothetical protein